MARRKSNVTTLIILALAIFGLFTLYQSYKNVSLSDVGDGLEKKIERLK